MGVMNTLKGNYIGKVGQTVGAKWKNLSTERVFTKPSNPNTQAQKIGKTAFFILTLLIFRFINYYKVSEVMNMDNLRIKDIIKNDGWMNLFSGLGTKADKRDHKSPTKRISHGCRAGDNLC